MILSRLVLVLCVSLVACAPDEAEDAQREARTQAQKDSAVARSNLPGAGAVGRALETSDAARDRAAATDSISR